MDRGADSESSASVLSKGFAPWRLLAVKGEPRTAVWARRTPQEGAPCLWEGALTPRRLRWQAWLLQFAVAVFGGWVWFGNAGAALMALWAYLWRPAAQVRVEIRPPVHWVRLPPHAITCSCGRGWLGRCRVRIYRDEMQPEAFVRLRRLLKEACARQGRADRPRPLA